jgi:hypothetical protein
VIFKLAGARFLPVCLEFWGGWGKMKDSQRVKELKVK